MSIMKRFGLKNIGFSISGKKAVGSFTVGIDDGARWVGIAVVNEHAREVVFGGTIKLRQDVSLLMERRKNYRRTRRSRKTRHRKCRFNRKRKKGRQGI